MTNQEAAEMIRNDMKLHHDALSGEYRKALSMAISALQAQEAKTQLSSAEVTTSGVKKTCITCKHYPPESKWPCIDCDMRNPADRWEAQEANNSNESSLTQKGLDTISRQAAIDTLRKREKELRNINWYNNPYAEGECEGISYAMDVIRNSPSAQPELANNSPELDKDFGECEDCISRQAVLDALDKLCDRECAFSQAQRNGMCNACHLGSAFEAIEEISSIQQTNKQSEFSKDSSKFSKDLSKDFADCISRKAAISELMEWVKKEENKSWSPFKGLFHWTGIKAMLECLPSAQPEPLSDAYTKAVWTWLLEYQIKAAELKGRYTPYEVLSWVANDWRKEHEGSD